jgi:hypothetical protein
VHLGSASRPERKAGVAVSVPIWLMDVDGVLNAFDESVPVIGDWSDWEVFTARGFPMRYSPSMIKRIRALHDSGVVEVRWLTTWGRYANTDLTQFGLPELKVQAEMPFRERHGWWKLPVVQQLFEKGRTIVWTDDDIVSDTKAMHWINEVATSSRHNDLYAYAPPGAITQEQMTHTEKWLEKR